MAKKKKNPVMIDQLPSLCIVPPELTIKLSGMRGGTQLLYSSNFASLKPSLCLGCSGYNKLEMCVLPADGEALSAQDYAILPERQETAN